MQIFFSVGEPSGDLHGANLIRSLRETRPEIECVGYGGPKMAEAGCQLHEDLTKYAVMWVARVLAKLPTFLALLRRADQYFEEHKPAAVVLIDYPGFNWWIARRAKARGIPVFYYGAPQLWAWAGWRVRKMRRLTDHVLCKLPFEPHWFSQRGCNAHYVGHPYFDELAAQKVDHSFVSDMAQHDRPRLTLLPGSRDQEVAKNLPALLKAAAIVQRDLPDVQVAVACFKKEQAERANQLVAASPCEAELFFNRTTELIYIADCCIACSGSVSLELMYHRTPSVIHYSVSRLAYVLQDWFRTARYITLVNLLATRDIRRRRSQLADQDDVPFPEYLAYDDAAPQMAEDVLRILTDDSHSHHVVRKLDALCHAYAATGASQRAAKYIVQNLPMTSQVPRPHIRSERRETSQGANRRKQR